MWKYREIQQKTQYSPKGEMERSWGSSLVDWWSNTDNENDCFFSSVGSQSPRRMISCEKSPLVSPTNFDTEGQGAQTRSPFNSRRGFLLFLLLLLLLLIALAVVTIANFNILLKDENTKSVLDKAAMARGWQKNKRSWNKEDVWSKVNRFVTERI